MQPTSLKSHLLILGAQTRLKELNKERNELLKILNIKEDITVKEYGIIKELNKIKAAPAVKKHRKYNGKHWMQRPENRAKMLRQIRKATKARFK